MSEARVEFIRPGQSRCHWCVYLSTYINHKFISIYIYIHTQTSVCIYIYIHKSVCIYIYKIIFFIYTCSQFFCQHISVVGVYVYIYIFIYHLFSIYIYRYAYTQCPQDRCSDGFAAVFFKEESFLVRECQWNLHWGRRLHGVWVHQMWCDVMCVSLYICMYVCMYAYIYICIKIIVSIHRYHWYMYPCIFPNSNI